MKNKWLRSMILGVFLSLILVSGISLAQTDIQEKPSSDGEQITALAAPPMSTFINIRVDALQNRDPAVAYNSNRNEYLVVWDEEIHGGEIAIYGRRVSSEGVEIGSAFPIAHNTNKQLTMPDVVYNSKHDEYLVVYTFKQSATDYDIGARQVKWNGALGFDFFVDYDLDWDWYPAVSYNFKNDEYMVVWEKYISNTRRDIEARRVSANTWTLLSWRNIAGSANMIRRLPDVVYNSVRNEFLIAYTRHGAASADGDIIGVRTNFNMSWPVLSELQITVPGAPPQDGVALAAGPDEYLAVWYEDLGTKYSIWGRRIAGDGALKPFISLANDTGKLRVEPAVGFGDGGHYLVVWRYIGGTWDIFGRQVRAGQNSPVGPEFAIDNEALDQKVPAVGCNPSGPCLVAYEDTYPGPDNEIRGRLVGYRRVLLPVTLRNH
jgi:uncharacterized protein YlbG (UPF0298 family)